MTHRAKWLKSSKVAVAGALMASSMVVGAQILRKPQPPPLNLARGEKIIGREHPEYFSRKIALQTMLDILSVHPEDAIHLQRRARLVETKRIGLGLNDCAALEQIVETYRVEERERKVQASAALLSMNKASDFADLKSRHQKSMQSVVGAINAKLSKEGKSALNRFLDDIISHSELQNVNAAPNVK